jgi:hypothetical protein
MRALICLEPLLARRAQDVPDHGEHRRKELVLGGVADDLVEADVLFDVRFARRDLPLLLGQDLAKLRELRVTDAGGRECGERRLDEPAELDDVWDAVPPRDKAVERPHEIVGRDLTDERAAAGPRLDDAQELERAQRLADGCPRDLELLCQRALGRELIAGPELALFKERLDLLDDALVEPAAPDGLDYGQFGPPGWLVRWSDQTK